MAQVIGIQQAVASGLQAIQRAAVKAGAIAVEQVAAQMDSGYGNPIWDTGATHQSLKYEMPGVGDTQVIFGVDTEYAPFVHDGTYKMVARPFIADVVNDPLFQQAVQEVVEEQLSGAFGG